MSRTIFAILSCAASLLAATPVLATPSQLRFSVSPVASDPIWKAAGVKFEKQGTCYVVAPTSTTPASPAAADIKGTFTAKAPLFNPGAPQPNGTYATAPDDGFNTLFIDIAFPTDTKSYISCKGAILANGVNATTAASGGLVTKTLALLGGTGPMTVSPVLDKTKLSPAIDKKGTFTLSAQVNGGSNVTIPLNSFDLDTATVKSGNDATAEIYVNLVGLGNEAKLGTKNGLNLASTIYSNLPTDPNIFQICPKVEYGGIMRVFNPLDINKKTICMKLTNGKYGQVTMTAVSKTKTGTATVAGTVYDSFMHQFTFAYVTWK